MRASRTAANGAEIAVTRRVRVVDDYISGVDALSVGEAFTYALVDPYIVEALVAEAAEAVDAAISPWRWLIDEGAGFADVFADGTVIARKVGTCVLRAINSFNSNLTFTKTLTIV